MSSFSVFPFSIFLEYLDISFLIVSCVFIFLQRYIFFIFLQMFFHNNIPIITPTKSASKYDHSAQQFIVTLSYTYGNTYGEHSTTTHTGSSHLATTVRIAERMMCLQPSLPARLKRLFISGYISNFPCCAVRHLSISIVGRVRSIRKGMLS